MPGGLARIIVYILLIVPLLVISLLVTRQVQFAFDLRKEAISVKGPANAALDLQQVMANSELSTRSFFLIFICFLMILFGLLIIFRGTEYAFSHSKEPRVKYSLRIAYPGLIMAIIGCLVLAYSVYKTSEVQRASTRQLLGVQPESGQPMKAADLIIYQPGTDTGSVTAIEETVVAKAAPGPVQQEEPVVAPATEKMQPKRVAISEPGYHYATDADVTWAEQMAARAIAFGYYPTAADEARFEMIENAAREGASARTLNEPLRWAYQLLQRTQRGYQPSQAELERYEAVITRQLGGGGAAGAESASAR